MYKQILVPLDGSALAERILPHVQAIAKGTGAKVLLFRVAPSAAAAIAAEAPGEARKVLEAEEARAAKYLEGVAKRLKDAGVVTKIEVSVGEPAVEIVMAAEKEKADLIALMSHGVTGLSHFDMGSVAEKVVKSSPRPVLLVRAFRTVPRILTDQEIWAIKK
jgi:nucleotide-binding universal stress UspA family protein